MPAFSDPFLAIVTETSSFSLTIVNALRVLQEHTTAQKEQHIVVAGAGSGAGASFKTKPAKTKRSSSLRLHILGAEWETEVEGQPRGKKEPLDPKCPRNERA